MFPGGVTKTCSRWPNISVRRHSWNFCARRLRVMSRPLMCHVVAGYPDKEGCLRLLRGMQQLGVAAIEVQIPFSDPIADGETIMRANDIALANGITTANSFELIETVRKSAAGADLYIMSYLQKVRHFGLSEFCKRASTAGVKGLIIPDLPYDSP